MNNDENIPFFRRWLFAEGETYETTRFVLLRAMGFIYFVAYLSLAIQVKPLIGDDGLLPANLFLDRVHASLGADAWLKIPTLFLFHCSDEMMQSLAWIGTGAAALVMLGATNAVLMAALWFLYLSFVHIGQLFYGYGWEEMTLEAGFLAIFWCPLRRFSPGVRVAVSPLLPLFFRWMLFRVMLGAGLIKIRGDECWRDLTCLAYHYETQPIPNPLSWYLHQMPLWFHQAGCLFNHFVELIVPFFYFAPRRVRHIAGVLTVIFQAILICSGNLSFLNWLTIVITIPCFDDQFFVRSTGFSRLFRSPPDRLKPGLQTWPSPARKNMVRILAIVIAILSIHPVMNLLSSHQAMNTSYDPLHLVNTYGAFGSVGKVRNEIIIEGSDDGITWKPYEFLAKPGDPRRRPAIIAPYQSRIDWQIWFAAMSEPGREPWLLHFIYKLLHNDAGALGLLRTNPFPHAPPRMIRCEYYEYHFTASHENGAWWERKYLGHWLPEFTRDDPRLVNFIRASGWRN